MGLDLGLGLERRKGTWLALGSTLFCLVHAWLWLIEREILSLVLLLFLFSFAA